MPLAKHGSFRSMCACMAGHHNYVKIILLNIDFHVNSLIYIQYHVFIHILFPRSHNHVHCTYRSCKTWGATLQHSVQRVQWGTIVSQVHVYVCALLTPVFVHVHVFCHYYVTSNVIYVLFLFLICSIPLAGHYYGAGKY